MSGLLRARDPAVIGLAGAAGSGKDTAAEYLCLMRGFEQLAFADPVRDMLAVLLECFGVDHAVLHERHLKERPIPQIPGAPSARELMQRLGDCMRQVHPDIWVAALAHRAGVHDLPRSAPIHDRLVISDVRYPNEAALVASLGGAVIRLQREQAAAVRAHDSERHAHEVPSTMDVINNGLTLHGLHEQLGRALDALGLDETA